MAHETTRPPAKQPAFPQPEQLYSEGRGMSLRDYFAAHAPPVPQPWFEPDVSDLPDLAEREPRWRAMVLDFIDMTPAPSERSKAIGVSWAKDPNWDIDNYEPGDPAGVPGDDSDPVFTKAECDWLASLQRAGDAATGTRKEHRRLLKARELEIHRRQQVGWPWVWADAVLAARDAHRPQADVLNESPAEGDDRSVPVSEFVATFFGPSGADGPYEHLGVDWLGYVGLVADAGRLLDAVARESQEAGHPVEEWIDVLDKAAAALRVAVSEPDAHCDTDRLRPVFRAIVAEHAAK